MQVRHTNSQDKSAPLLDLKHLQSLDAESRLTTLILDLASLSNTLYQSKNELEKWKIMQNQMHIKMKLTELTTQVSQLEDQANLIIPLINIYATTMITVTNLNCHHPIRNLYLC